MSEKGSVTKGGGSGLLTAGIVIAVVIAAGTYMNMRSPSPLSEEDLAAVVPAGTEQDAPSSVEAPAIATGKTDPVAAETGQLDAGTDTETASASSDKETADEQTSAEVDIDVAADAETEAQSQTEAAVAPQTEGETAVAEAAPSIDEVRVEADGVAVIAGRAAPGSDVEVVVDGDVVATTRADSSGSFAALGTVDAADGAQVLSLRATQDNESVVSRNEVIIAPVTRTAPVPAAEPVTPIAPVTPVEQEAETALEDQSGSERVETVQEAADTDTTVAVVLPQPAADTSATQDDGAGTQDADAGSGASPGLTQASPETPLAETPTAPAQIAVLQSNEDGVSLLQTAPAPPSQVVLDTIGYSDSGVVQLAGRASKEATEVRIYLDNRALIDLPVDTAGGWRGAVPDIDAGVYTLRVDALTAEGDVASRIETPFKREEPEVLARATAGRSGPVTAVTVQTGDTLWAIARERYGEGILYVRVFDANRSDIRDPDLIYPGQVFDLPDD